MKIKNMNILKILDIFFLTVLLVIGIETFIKLKKSENKQIEEVRKVFF